MYNTVVPTMCPLCGAPDPLFWHEDKRRPYMFCTICSLVFVHPHHYVSLKAEKAEYDLHENSPADSGYRNFLHRICAPVMEHMPACSAGLDFGCGPQPVLAGMLEEQGHDVCIYDYFYYPDISVFYRQYDFITASEVFEHLHRPAQELDRLYACLRPGGLLAVMTKPVSDRQAFGTWYYKEEQSHVCFYSEAAFAYIGETWGFRFEQAENDVVLLWKKGS